MAFTWANESEAVAVLEGLRKLENDWAVFGYNDSALALQHHGKGTLNDFRDLLSDDAVNYVALGQTVPDQDEGAGFVDHRKYILITWVGTKCKPMQKASSSQHRRPLYQYILKYVQLGAELQALEPAELTEAVILEKLRGTRVEKNEGSSSPAPTRAASSPKPVATTAEKNHAPGLMKPITTRSTATTSSFSNTAVKTEVNFENEQQANELLQELRNDSTSTNWLLFGHTADGKGVKVLGSGSEGLSGLLPFFQDDVVVYGILGQLVKDTDEGDFSATKYIFISWVGPNVKPMTKARSSQTRVALYKHAKNYLQLHAELQVLDKAEISEKIVLDKLCSTF